jgi:hypothetical protein
MELVLAGLVCPPDRNDLITYTLNCCPSSNQPASRNPGCSGSLRWDQLGKTSSLNPQNRCWPAGGRAQPLLRPSMPLCPKLVTQVRRAAGNSCLAGECDSRDVPQQLVGGAG